MIRDFIKVTWRWILLFCFLQLLLLFVAYIDSSIQLSSIVYIIFLSFVIFSLFVIIRYNKETTFYKSLKDWHPSNDLAELEDASNPWERLAEQKVGEQSIYYKEKIDHLSLELEQEKDELLSWIHEVKTPLTALQLMIERVENRELKEQLMYEWLRVHLLLDQQMHQKRIPFMENDLYMEKVDLKTVIYQEVKGLQSWCMQKGIGIDVELEVEEVLTDAKWFGFILRQLLTNSVKYSQDAEIEINSYRENEQIHVVIQDYGIGISNKDLPRIFEKGFTSTENHQTNQATGMGLYLTKKVADVLKIEINVQSEWKKGTRFKLTFPVENEFVAITSM